MSVPGCVVIERQNDWMIVVGDESEQLTGDQDAGQLAACADQLAKRSGIKNPNCILAPDSTSCFFARLSPNADIDVRDRTALAFELEDHLPIDAESMVADFVVVPSSQMEKTVAAVAVPTERWKKIAEAMESSGLPVRSIVPRAILAARALSDSIELDETTELLLVADDQCDAITLENRTIAAWKYFRVDADPLRRHRLLDGGDAKTVLVTGSDANQQSTIADVYPSAIRHAESTDAAVLRGASALLTHPSNKWFDLRRDALGPSDPLRAIQKQIRLLGVAAVTCLLAVAVGGWWRATRIEQQLAGVRAQQQQLFREAFPNSQVPGALLRRVRSEHTKVLGSRGATTEIDIPVSAPTILRELLSALPGTVRFRITRIKILDGRVDLDLQVRSPVDAGALATSLSAAGFDVEPPGTTQKDAQTFESLLEAKWVGQTKGATAAEADVSVNISIANEVAG